MLAVEIVTLVASAGSALYKALESKSTENPLGLDVRIEKLLVGCDVGGLVKAYSTSMMSVELTGSRLPKKVEISSVLELSEQVGDTPIEVGLSTELIEQMGCTPVRPNDEGTTICTLLLTCKGLEFLNLIVSFRGSETVVMSPTTEGSRILLTKGVIERVPVSTP